MRLLDDVVPLEERLVRRLKLGLHEFSKVEYWSFLK